MVKFQTAYDYNPDDHLGEVNNEPSMTVPDMSYTVQELLEKFVRGVPPSINQKGQFDEDPDFDFIDPARLGEFDLTDLTEMEFELQETLARIQDAKAEKKVQEAVALAPEKSGEQEDGQTGQ